MILRLGQLERCCHGVEILGFVEVESREEGGRLVSKGAKLNSKDERAHLGRNESRRCGFTRCPTSAEEADGAVFSV